MKYKIIIDYNVSSEIVLDDKLEFEYYKKKEWDVFTDDISFSENKIFITGKRFRKIDIENDWKSKRSNYRRSILSSIFYVYNFYKKPIKISSITFEANNQTKQIPFVQEFSNELPNEFAINTFILRNKLFKTITHAEISSLLLRTLQL